MIFVKLDSTQIHYVYASLIVKHHHQHRIGNGEDDISNIRVAFFLNFGFAIIEIIGGLLTNSVAILSDALHDFGDSLTLGLAWYFQRLSKKNRDQKFSYGYSRFSLMGAIVSSVILIIGSIFIINEAIPRLIEPQEAHAGGMAGLAILGIVVNGAAALRLRRGSSMNERVVALHLLEDVLGWTAVLIGAIIMHFKDWPWIDPVLSLLIAAIILFNVYRNLKKTLKIILQSTPEGIDPSEVMRRLTPLLQKTTTSAQRGQLIAMLTATATADGRHDEMTVFDISRFAKQLSAGA